MTRLLRRLVIGGGEMVCDLFCLFGVSFVVTGTVGVTAFLFLS